MSSTDSSVAQSRPGWSTRASRALSSDKVLRWLLLAPAITVIFAVFIYPLAYSFWMSLHAYNIITPARFIGLRNYERILTDERFWQSVKVSFSFALPTFTLELLVGFFLALLLNRDIRGKGFIRSVILIPLMLTPVVVGLNWRVMFNYDFGIVNWLIGLAGIGKLNWVNDVRLALPALVILEMWRSTSFVVLVMSAGLAALPDEPYEAAEIDGASAWQQLIHLTLPMLKPLFLVVAMFRSYELLRVFDIVYTLTGGGPGRATETLSFHVFNRLIEGWQIGYASASAYILFLISLGLVMLIIRVLGLSGFEGDG